MTSSERLTHPDVRLVELASRVWGTSEAGLLSVDGNEANSVPAGQRFVVVPSVRRARRLIPLEASRAASGTLTANLGLRRARQRLPLRLVGAALDTHVPQRLLRRQYLGVADEPGGQGQEPLLAFLQENWRHDAAALGLSVLDMDPNHKPTIMAVDKEGQALGFAKVGWNDGTIRRLQAEAGALRLFDSSDVLGLRTPRLLKVLWWRERCLVIVEPLPPEAQRYPRPRHAPLPLVRHALAGPLARSVACDDVAMALVDALPAGAPRELFDGAHSMTAAMRERFGGLPLAQGLTHGDWVPWNLALASGVVYAWDWEHVDPAGVVYLDLAHWHVQLAHIRDGRPLPEAFDRAMQPVTEQLRSLGLGHEECQAVMDLYLLQCVQRATTLAESTGLWRPGVSRGLLGLLKARL